LCRQFTGNYRSSQYGEKDLCAARKPWHAILPFTGQAMGSYPAISRVLPGAPKNDPVFETSLARRELKRLTRATDLIGMCSALGYGSGHDRPNLKLNFGGQTPVARNSKSFEFHP
jgi:hypothetical protein